MVVTVVMVRVMVVMVMIVMMVVVMHGLVSENQFSKYKDAQTTLHKPDPL